MNSGQAFQAPRGAASAAGSERAGRAAAASGAHRRTAAESADSLAVRLLQKELRSTERSLAKYARAPRSDVAPPPQELGSALHCEAEGAAAPCEAAAGTVAVRPPGAHPQGGVRAGFGGAAGAVAPVLSCAAAGQPTAEQPRADTPAAAEAMAAAAVAAAAAEHALERANLSMELASLRAQLRAERGRVERMHIELADFEQIASQQRVRARARARRRHGAAHGCCAAVCRPLRCIVLSAPCRVRVERRAVVRMSRLRVANAGPHAMHSPCLRPQPNPKPKPEPSLILSLASPLSPARPSAPTHPPCPNPPPAGALPADAAQGAAAQRGQ